ncbi:CHC2 zinc finger domain-containing protein [Cupriavidus sp. 30B13]|uniref:CHC2 zinc finger domain-containing protein n=1 Tax=Cupriavidus sp. 30B13 TaxID=3384241 RepID=UPI003B8F58ED
MPRIPDTELERLKTEISVQRLVEGSGVALQKSGKDWLGLCPFHEDREPSLVVSPGKNLWHCFGCQVGGGPIDWVMKHKGVSFRHAVELLRADPALAAGVGSGRATVRSLPPPVTPDADDQALLDQVVGYYHETLKQSPEALAYLAARGLSHPEVVERFQLGYANRTLGLRLPLKNRVAGAELRTRLQRIGILRESGHEHFNGSLVIPVLDGEGQAVEVYGRKLRDDLRPGTPKHLYLPGPHRGLFNLAGVIEAGARTEAGARELIVCEALIDALTFWVHGYTNVTAAYGVEGFSDDMLATVQASGIVRVFIAYDRDEAGERGAERLGERLLAAGLEVLRVQLPRGMDVNEYARKLQPAPQALALVLRQARWVGRAPEVCEAPENLTPAAEEKTIQPGPVLTPEPSVLAAAVPAPTTDTALPALADDVQGDELTLHLGACQWRVRGWRKNLSPEQMRVNLQVRQEGTAEAAGGYHVDTLDLYAARARAAFLRQASAELGLPEDALKRDLGHLLLRLETLQDEALHATQVPKSAVPVLSADEEAEALALLRVPNLCERIAADLQACGVVGEATNLLAGYLAATSRKLDTPLAVLIQSSSAAGKSSLMEAVLAMMPPEERIQYSAMTGQSLFYLGETDLQHKILAIAEEEGVRQAAYALKLLQSDGQLTIASTGKDETTGNLVTKQYRVQGPVMLMLTTTAIDVDEELLNRCLVLTVNESREQTRAIHARQRHRQTLDGLLAETNRSALIELHRNAQRLLKPVHVVNPYAQQLSFGDHQTRTRRDHTKYLSLIRAIALLHQHQRAFKHVEHRGQTLAYIEVTRQDIALANEVAHEVLGRTLDELPPQTRKLLTLLREWVSERCRALGIALADFRFTRRELREAVHWGDTQLKVHLARLVEMEFLAVHRRGLSHTYELVYDGDGERAHLCGLREVESLRDDGGQQYDPDRSGPKAKRSASGRGQVGARSALGRTPSDSPPGQVRRGLDDAAASRNGADGREALFRHESVSPVIPSAA